MKFFKKIAIVLSVGIIISGIFSVQCVQALGRITAIAIKLHKKGYDANMIVRTLYKVDTRLLTADEQDAAREWKRRLYQHVVDERRHFMADPGAVTTDRFNGQATSSCNITLGEAIDRLATAKAFRWSKGGYAILVNLENNGKVDAAIFDKVEVSNLDESGTVVSTGPAEGVHVELKISSDTRTNDVGQIYYRSGAR